ncbi:hypothetical protein RI129_007175 [Pyrocoelia pectoralis]|uniref:Evolutionarily conserved signaling intermediate in Toll pathway, mitochondrial n=1 Tax=Pyrocoelia pectoralis TaxID=417401 RepID=A0AAN7V7H0_9COLE
MFRLLISHFHTSVTVIKNIVIYDNFESITSKTRDAYLDMIKIFENKGVQRQGHVEFIYSALRNMKEFSVEKDLEVYKALINVLPKGKYIPTNIFQSEFMHYPKQQQCAIDLLEQMEDNAVLPDEELEKILLNTFGKRGFPLRKLWRMAYWMPKFKNLSPWPLPYPLPSSTLELAKLAVTRMSTADLQTQIRVFQTRDVPDTREDTWIVSAQSKTQRRLVSEHDTSQPMYVEGTFRIWIKNVPINYFLLRADAKCRLKPDMDLDDVSNIPVPMVSFGPSKKEVLNYTSVHEQKDGVIFAICITGTSSCDSLLSWIRHLEKDGNSSLSSIPIVFSLKTAEKEMEKVVSSIVK